MSDLRVIFVTGDREWTDRAALRGVFALHQPGAWLLQGGCRGADLLSESMCCDFGFQPLRMDATWGYHGTKGGPIRNREMGRLLAILRDAGAAVTCYAVHDDLEHSKGTRDMISVLDKLGFKWTRVRGSAAPATTEGEPT